MVASFAVDMWSLGMLAYEIFEGCVHPWLNRQPALPVIHVC